LLFESIIRTVSQPDLLIYLKADIPKLVSQIKKRGRDLKRTFQPITLPTSIDYYEDFVTNYDHGKILEIDVNEMDFAANPADFEYIVQQLNKELFYI
jgi:deoxyadenosine/deoxycytidine kinase